MKRSLCASAIIALILPAFALAANDVTLTTSTVISVGPYLLNVSGSSAVIDSIVVEPSDLIVTLSSGSSIAISSPTLNQLSSNVTSDVTGNICNSSASSMTLSYSGGGTVANTITPSAALCADAVTAGSSGGTSTSGGSSSGGGGGSPVPAYVPKPVLIPIASGLPATAGLRIGSQGGAVTELQDFLIAQGYLGASYNTGYFGPLTQKALAAYQKDHDISPASPITVIFTRDLTIGSTGSDVRALQQFLNAHDAIVASSGPGSVGNETAYFGSATQAALIRFQKTHSISPAAGYFGPVTRRAVTSFR